MLYLTASSLLILWLLAYVNAYTLGGFIPIVLILSGLLFAGGFLEKRWERKEYV